MLVDAFDIHEDEDLILFHIEGSHFIWKMVRRLVGVLVEVGRGGIAPAAVRTLLSGNSDEVARLTAPASGLFLERVYYPDDPRDAPVRSTVTLRQCVSVASAIRRERRHAPRRERQIDAARVPPPFVRRRESPCSRRSASSPSGIGNRRSRHHPLLAI